MKDFEQQVIKRLDASKDWQETHQQVDIDTAKDIRETHSRDHAIVIEKIDSLSERMTPLFEIADAITGAGAIGKPFGKKWYIIFGLIVLGLLFSAKQALVFLGSVLSFLPDVFKVK